MSARQSGRNRTMGRVVSGVVAVMTAAVLSGGSAAAAYHGTSDLTINQQAHPTAGLYFGVPRTTAGYIPGL